MFFANDQRALLARSVELDVALVRLRDVFDLVDISLEVSFQQSGQVSRSQM
jgi:hypothetical protein